MVSIIQCIIALPKTVDLQSSHVLTVECMHVVVCVCVWKCVWMDGWVYVVDCLCVRQIGREIGVDLNL